MNFEWPVGVKGNEQTVKTELPEGMQWGFYWMQTDEKCFLNLKFKDSADNEYTSGRIACDNTTVVGIDSFITVTYTKAATSTTAAKSYTYNVAFTSEVYDLAESYTWDGSYVDPTFCDNETQKMMVDSEMDFQEGNCFLNGLICSFPEPRYTTAAGEY